MGQKVKRRLGELLVEDGLLTQAQLEEALKHQKENKGLLGQILIEKKFVEEDVLVGVLSKQFKIPFLSLKNYSIDPDMAEVLSADFCHENMLVAFDCDHKRVYVALADPLNDDLVTEKIKAVTRREPQIFLARVSEILNAIYFIYHENP